MNSEKITVTKPALPPLDEFIPYLEQIWEGKILTNNGQFHEQFELELCRYLGVKHISLFCNGTIALITALQALQITGEVITTPFSFVATTHALWWNNIKPVFTDVEPDYFTLDPAKIEAAITPETTAILPVHVYGNPCNVEEIKKIADKHGLKVIYDACHTFGVKIKDIPVLNFGDLSVMSFHATKVFTTFEGGAIVCHDEATKKHIDHLKNFGFVNETTVITPGINAKMNEFQAALGLLQLKYIEQSIKKRKLNAEYYRANLANIPGITFLNNIPDVTHCFSYFPVLINRTIACITRDELYNELKQFNVHTRRYFYPLISQFPIYRDLDSARPGNLKVAENISEQVICLPIYPDLQECQIKKIVNVIKELANLSNHAT